MTDNEIDDRLIAALDAVPAHDESPIAVDELSRRAGFDGAAAAVVGPVLLRLLGSFGVLRVAESADGATLVKAAEPASTLFLRSYAEHLRTGRDLLDSWDRPVITDPPYPEQQALSGPQFLHLIERRRLRAGNDARALRRTEVAQVVISRHIKGRPHEYLLLHDEKARQYQLPGGRRRPGDRDAADIAVRELQEELPDFEFDPDRDRLVRLGSTRATAVSRTFGVITEYDLTIFHLRSTRTGLPSGPGGTWVDGKVLLTENSTVNGLSTNLLGLRTVDKDLPGGVCGLEPSFQASERSWVATAAVTRPLEFWGFVVGVFSLIISIVFYIFS
ncbi:hypothetical protein ACQP1P_01790 [Dactylosporangium sp. CA-052675]|uniref:hypothetical protein n=1 Tax=Dactylosporangium sp. CA-052675 TaxID=3239927 RepID=UPI003D8D2D03